MKENLRNLFTLIGLLCGVVVSAQVESAIELMADTASWENYDAQVGGADSEDETIFPLFNEESIELGLWDVNDSIAYIPAYDEYCHWDTRNLWQHKQDILLGNDTLWFKLIHAECDFVFPAPGHLTSPFGPRWGRMHSGLDLDLETGDPVVAAFEGMVRISQYHASYGNVVVIRHSSGLETLYAHLSHRDVKPGDYVQAGTQIGLGGNTGRSYGSHLHFEIRYLGTAIDPNFVVDPTHRKLRSSSFALTKEILELPAQLAKQSNQSSSGRKYHTVRSGETLSGIARKRGTSVSALCKMNKLRPSSVIRPGQKLRYR